MTSPPQARRVHVMHVVHQLQPGGMEYGLIKLVNGLARGPAGGPVEGPVRSSICSTCPADPTMAASLDADVHLVQLARRAGTDVGIVWQLYQLFRRERPSVVHTHAWGTLLEGLLAARAARVPVVVHGEHGTLQLQPRQVRLQRWAWQRADRLLSVSSRLAERMAVAIGVPLDSITVLRNGVDTSRFGGLSRDEARRRFGVDDDTVLVGHVGRLVEVKDQASLVRAAALLKTRGLRFRVLIAGNGPLRDRLDRLVTELGVDDCVTLLGHLADVEWLQASLDVYVLCSRSEGMPNTILEAMASGVAVVSTRVGGADELVVPEETGLLVPAAQPEALAEALGQLIADSGLRTAMGRAGRARATTQFSVEAMVDGYEQMYLQACGLGQRATPAA